MAKLLKLRLGVSDDPTALQPSLNDCLEVMLQQADALVDHVLEGLEIGATATGPRKIPGFDSAPVKAAIAGLRTRSDAVGRTFAAELKRLVYEGGGKDQVHTETLRFEDLQLFEEDQIDQSIEVARAQQEVAAAVDDSLPALDALISTMLGWRTIQPGLNPLRPEVFVRALQFTLSEHVPDASVREKLITPAAGLLGVNLRQLYRELTDWLRSTGIEPAVPVGGRLHRGAGAQGQPVNDSSARTLLTLDRLRQLLAGDFDQPRGRPDFLHTVPASMSMLQDMKKADELIRRLEERARPAPPPQEPVDMLADDPAPPPASSHKIGQQLGQEVVRLMFENLTQDARLLPAFKRKLRAIEPAVQRLTKEDSRFFSDRNHAARQLLDRLTQRSLAFNSENDPGFPAFMESVDAAIRWLESKVVDADTFGELLDHLQARWAEQDQALKHRREEAARALLHAEQRNLLAQKLAQEFEELLEGLDVADFIRDFLKGSWAQVVAEAQLSCADGSADPYGYRALVDDLIWSVQKTSAQRGRARRLVQMIPGILQRLREGLQRIGYPPELTQHFFDRLILLHRAAVQAGRDPEAQAAAEAAWAAGSDFRDSGDEEVQMWLDQNEVTESGFLQAEDFDLDFTAVASPAAGQLEAEAARLEAIRKEARDKARAAQAEAERRHAAAEEAAKRAEQLHAEAMRAQAERERARREQAEREQAGRRQAEWEEARRREAEAEEAARQEAERLQAEWEQAVREQEAALAAAREAERARAAGDAGPAVPLRVEELRIGTWVELHVKGEWVRAQLTWASPHATLFMFTSISGSAHSMSRRTLDKLRVSGQIKVVADRPVVDEALDQVAQVALKNSLDRKD